MNAVEIINEIKHLPPGEQAKVARYLGTLGKGRQLTPAELDELAGRMVNESNPAKAEKLKEEIVEGFYGTKPGA